MFSVIYSGHTERKVTAMKNPDSKSKVVSIASARCTLYNAAVDREQNFIGKKIAEARNNNGLSLASFSRLMEAYVGSVSPADSIKC